MNPQLQYINHPLNTSYCKYAYKFSQSKRFKTPRKMQDFILSRKTQFTYVQKQSIKNNGTKFPRSKRVGLETKNQYPPPNTYSLGNLVQQKSKNKFKHIKGGLMGFGRQMVRFKSMMSECDKKSFLPAPNNYDLPQTLKQKNVSFRIKLPSQLQIKLKKAQTPGPGEYKLIQTNQTGKYSVSNIKNVRRVFLDGQKRYPQFNNISISPDKYDLQNVSNFRKTVISFAKAKRKLVVDKYRQSVPGPGMYQTFSQFGKTKLQCFSQSKEYQS